MPAARLFGASVKRVEDPRFLLGKATYVDDIRLPGTLGVALVRSPHAHARIKSIDTSKALQMEGVVRVLTGEEAAKRAKPQRVEFDMTRFPGEYKPCDWPCIAVGKVRFVGDIVAAVVAESRYVAEDAAELVEVEYEPLPAVVDAEKGMEPGAPLVHEEWGDNIMLRVKLDAGETDKIFREADCVVRERFKTNRHCASPLESRGCLATYDAARGEMTLWTSTQMPHMVRSLVAEMLSFPEQKLRVIGPDVGGGFGLKCHVFPEEVIVCLLAWELGRPVKWIEDRRENLLGSFHAKEEIAYGEIATRKDGTILGLRAKFIGDMGAYTSYPWTPCFEPFQAVCALPGPYKIHNYQYEAIAVATNKTTLSVYRGVGLPPAAFVMESLVDMVARELKLDPAEVRRKNMIPASEFPYRTPSGLEYDSASNIEALEKALEMVGYKDFRKQQEELRKQGRYIGVGISSLIEMTTFGPSYWSPLGVKSVSGYDSAAVRVDPSGGVTLSVGTFSHGQGHATVYAQLAADELGVDMESVRLEQGDTMTTPYGWGTWGSRSAVAGGGAVIRASQKVREKMLRIASHLLEVSVGDLEFEGGKVSVKGVPGKSLTVQEIARAAVYTAEVPEDEEPGLEATYYYKPPTPYANATHIAVVEVDVETGQCKILKYVVAHDCGKIINPMIVDAQIHGGVAQGLGNAIYENLLYDENGQLLTSTLMDYLLPSAADVPHIEVAHFETPSPFSVGGIKGMGEGGAIAPPAAIGNAVADALSPFNVRIIQLPITPELVRSLVTQKAAA